MQDGVQEVSISMNKDVYEIKCEYKISLEYSPVKIRIEGDLNVKYIGLTVPLSSSLWQLHCPYWSNFPWLVMVAAFSSECFLLLSVHGRCSPWYFFRFENLWLLTDRNSPTLEIEFRHKNIFTFFEMMYNEGTRIYLTWQVLVTRPYDNAYGVFSGGFSSIRATFSRSSSVNLQLQKSIVSAVRLAIMSPKCIYQASWNGEREMTCYIVPF